MTRARLTVDTDRCVGHGRCFSLQPDLFDGDDEGYPIVLQENVPQERRGGAENAVINCPERAITLATDDAG